MLSSLIIPVGWILLIFGGILYIVINAYQKVRQFDQARYHLLPDQAIPNTLFAQTNQLQRTGYQYLAAYALKLPPAFKRTPPIAYTFQSDDGSSVAMLTQHRNMQGTGFQSLFPDDALLVTVQGLPASPLLQTGTDEKYQLNQVSGGLAEAYAYHKKKLEAFKSVHGDPLSIQTPSEYLDLVNDYMLRNAHKRLAESIIKTYRRILGFVLLVLISINAMFVWSQAVAGQAPIRLTGPMLAPSVPFLLLAVFIIVFRGRIKRNYMGNNNSLRSDAP